MDIETVIKQLEHWDKYGQETGNFQYNVYTNARDMLLKVMTERDEALEKLAAMENQEPVASVKSINRHGDIDIVAVDDTLRVGDLLYAKPAPADKPAARITEQDAREIFVKVLEDQEHDFDYWLDTGGRELLNKLNADREQVPAATVPDRFNGDDKKLVECATSLLNLDAKGALTPHGLGGHARTIIESFVSRYGSPHSQQSAQAGYAGVTVWMGDKACTQYVSRLEVENSKADELLRRFENARFLISQSDRCPIHESEGE